MKKSIVAFAVLSGNVAFACAQSSLTGYDAPETSQVQESSCAGCADTAGGAPGERVAIHGVQPVGKHTSVIFTMEQEVPDEFGRADEAQLFGRQAFFGLVNDVGAVTLGRQYSLDYLTLTDVGDPFRGGTAGSAGNLIGSGARRAAHGMQFRTARVRGVTAGASYGTGDMDGSPASRAWGMTVGIETGPLTLRVAHQNRHVAQVHLYDMAGNNMEAKNSIIAANMKMKWGTAYAAYSANRGWGSSPLFNPDNPYGAGVVASTPSTDSRDVLVGVAVPWGRYTTLLASFIHKNDRDLANRDANQLAFGATYMVSRHTDFYAAWSRIQNTNGAGYTVGNINGRSSGSSALNIGMRHAF